jgi:hypothetical protein
VYRHCFTHYTNLLWFPRITGRGWIWHIVVSCSWIILSAFKRWIVSLYVYVHSRCMAFISYCRKIDMKQNLQVRMFLFSSTWDYVHMKYALLWTLQFFISGLEHQGTPSPGLTLTAVHNPDSRARRLCLATYGTHNTLHLIQSVLTYQIFIGRLLDGNLSRARTHAHTHTYLQLQVVMIRT